MGWLQVGAQVVPAIPPGYMLAPPVIKDTVPRWVRKVNLQPHEFITFKPETEVDGIRYGPVLKFQGAVSKDVLVNKRDSILAASRLFARQIKKRLRWKNKGIGVTLSALYFDRACANAGMSRRIIYTIIGRECKLYSDTSFDDSNRLDSAISSRLHLFPLQPGQYFIYDHEANVIILDKVTPKCVKDWYYRYDTTLTPATKVTYMVLFEVVQHSFPKVSGVACGCTAPWGEYHVDATLMTLKQESLRTQYDWIYQEYRKGRYP